MLFSPTSSATLIQFPVISSTGPFEDPPSQTTIPLSFAGIGFCPPTVQLQVESSVGGAGPWAAFGAFPMVVSLSGSTVGTFNGNDGTFVVGTFYRARWHNATMGIDTPWIDLGHTT